MRRGATVLVVVVIAGIAVAAGFDALRGGSGPDRAVESRPEPPATSTQQAFEELAGVLYYTDENCRLRAAELPDLAPAEAPTWSECSFALSPDERTVSGAGSGWDPSSGALRARLFQSGNGLIQVSTDAGPEGEPFRGQAPAWRLDGTLTYFAGGAVRTWPDGDVVLSQRDLVRTVRTIAEDVGSEFLAQFDRFRFREAAWLDDRRLAAILSAEGPESGMDMLGIYDGTELGPFTFDVAGGLSDLRASPGGRYVTAKSTGGRDTPGGFVMLEWGQGERTTPRIDGYRALAWSPDDQWMAVAADDGVFLYQPGAAWLPGPELDFDAQDLDWRGEPRGPELAEADEAREWLCGVGATGRLLVSVPGCRLRAQRLPDLVWEAEPDVPAPCRFTLTPNDAPLDEAISVSPTGELRAVCEGGGLRVFQNGGFRTLLTGACAPAWMGDGTLTFLRDGGLWRGIEDARRLLSREEVGEMFGRPSSLEEVAWLDDERFWAVVRSGENAIVALMAADGLVFSPSFTAREIEGLRVSATGMVAARTDQGVVFFDSGGRRALTFPNGRAVAWAPGELYAAVATPGEVLFVAPVSREVVPVSLEVADLEWVVP